MAYCLSETFDEEAENPQMVPPEINAKMPICEIKPMWSYSNVSNASKYEPRMIDVSTWLAEWDAKWFSLLGVEGSVMG